MQWLNKLRNARTNPTADTAISSPSVAEPIAETVPRPEDDPNFVDVKQLIQTLSLEELCQTAEDYFRDIPSPMSLIIKPLRVPNEAPHHLIRFCQVVEGLDLWPNHVVLDFGAGPGWASRLMTQMRCKVILTDVSPSALNIARALYEQLPPLGTVPPPTFLPFDGRHLDVPDASVDRIFCFDAFHHVPNPTEIIHEMGRILAPGGIAGFSEPGPDHSKSAASQYEMQNYRVVENDVHIEQIWADAQAAGFDDLRIAVYYVPPFHLNLTEFNEFLAGGPPLDRFAQTVRGEMQGARLFFLTKAGGVSDSRSAPDGLRCQMHVTMDTEKGTNASAGSGVAELTNTGTSAWRTVQESETETPYSVPSGTVLVGVHLLDASGKLIEIDFARASVRQDGVSVLPGESVRVPFTLPPLPAAVAAPGTAYRLAFDLVSEDMRWFADIAGGAPAVVVERQA